MIDPENESPISLSDAAKSLPGRPNVTTIWRWRSRGIAGVRLETLCVGGRTYTTREALARFLERVTAAKSGQPIPSRSNRQRERDRSEARKQLAAAGLL
jgi:hypothetical protein